MYVNTVEKITDQQNSTICKTAPEKIKPYISFDTNNKKLQDKLRYLETNKSNQKDLIKQLKKDIKQIEKEKKIVIIENKQLNSKLN